MKRNPTITDLLDNSHYKLIESIEHKKIKEFVINELKHGGKLTSIYMIYQLLMIVLGGFIFVITLVQGFKGDWVNFKYTIGALVFSLSGLVIIHELIHGLVLKIVGAKKVNYGGYLKKFIFYAEADKFVMNKIQFAKVAMFPLFVIKIISILGIVFFFSHPVVYSFIIVMSLHSLFCAGDIGLLSFFIRQKGDEVFTYDNKSEKKSYYYKLINSVKK